MPKRTQAPFLSFLAAAEAAVAMFSTVASLPAVAAGQEPPEWITVFPTLGDLKCRDGRRYTVDAAVLTAAFANDGIDLPVDINHAIDRNLDVAEAFGWAKELRVADGQLQARIDWLDDGKALLAAKKYRYISPSFYHDKEGRALRLKTISLVNSPALGNQPALASAGSNPPAPELSTMKPFATALGLAESATDVECLSALTALNERLAASVPKTVHDETLAQLSSASTELAALKKAARDSKVEGLIEAALSAKKITPAEREHYVALCASDDGLAAVEKLIDAKTPLMPGSGLDKAKQPDGDQVSQDPVKLAALAAEFVDKEEAAGRRISYAEAMIRVTEKRD